MRPDDGVGRARFGEDFERHVSVELGVAGAVDLAPTAPIWAVTA